MYVKNGILGMCSNRWAFVLPTFRVQVAVSMHVWIAPVQEQLGRLLGLGTVMLPHLDKRPSSYHRDPFNVF